MNEADRELLEFAARAAGYDVHLYQREPHECWGEYDPCFMLDGTAWNPLTDDGDAFRLACALKLNLKHGDFSVVAEDEADILDAAVIKKEEDLTRLARLVIVHAAADIGRAMP